MLRNAKSVPRFYSVVSDRKGYGMREIPVAELSKMKSAESLDTSHVWNNQLNVAVFQSALWNNELIRANFKWVPLPASFPGVQINRNFLVCNSS